MPLPQSTSQSELPSLTSLRNTTTDALSTSCPRPPASSCVAYSHVRRRPATSAIFSNLAPVPSRLLRLFRELADQLRWYLRCRSRYSSIQKSLPTPRGAQARVFATTIRSRKICYASYCNESPCFFFNTTSPLLFLLLYPLTLEIPCFRICPPPIRPPPETSELNGDRKQAISAA